MECAMLQPSKGACGRIRVIQNANQPSKRGFRILSAVDVRNPDMAGMVGLFVEKVVMEGVVEKRERRYGDGTT